MNNSSVNNKKMRWLRRHRGKAAVCKEERFQGNTCTTRPKSTWNGVPLCLPGVQNWLMWNTQEESNKNSEEVKTKGGKIVGNTLPKSGLQEYSLAFRSISTPGGSHSNNFIQISQEEMLFLLTGFLYIINSFFYDVKIFAS